MRPDIRRRLFALHCRLRPLGYALLLSAAVFGLLAVLTEAPR